MSAAVGIESTLLDRRIPVAVFFSKIPLTGRVFKESVKHRPTESPTSADDASLKLPAAHILPHNPRIKPEHFCRLRQRREPILNRGNRTLLFPLRGDWTPPLFAACFPPVLRRGARAQNGRKSGDGRLVRQPNRCEFRIELDNRRMESDKPTFFGGLCLQV
jgi:hypothetical protein